MAIISSSKNHKKLFCNDGNGIVHGILVFNSKDRFSEISFELWKQIACKPQMSNGRYTFHITQPREKEMSTSYSWLWRLALTYFFFFFEEMHTSKCESWRYLFFFSSVDSIFQPDITNKAFLWSLENAFLDWENKCQGWTSYRIWEKTLTKLDQKLILLARIDVFDFLAHSGHFAIFVNHLLFYLLLHSNTKN